MESKIQLTRKISSSKGKLNVVIVVKIFYIKNMKHTGTKATLIMSKNME